MEHGAPNAGPRVKFFGRTDHAIRLRTRSLAGLAARRDDVVRAQTAWAVEEPNTTKIAPEHPKVLITDHGHVELDVDVSFGEAHDVRCQIALDGVEADIVRVGTGTAVHPGGGPDGDDQATGTKCGSRVIMSIGPRESVGDRNPVLEASILTAARQGVKRSGRAIRSRSLSGFLGFPSPEPNRG